jgi:hypothetical protein
VDEKEMKMAQFTGMDISAVRTLSNQLTQSAGEINNLSARLTSALEGTPWVGPDREQFLGDWQGQHLQSLRLVAQSLEEAARRASMNADQQEQASA